MESTGEGSQPAGTITIQKKYNGNWITKGNLEFLFYAFLLLLVLLLVVTFSIGTHSLCNFVNSLVAAPLFNLSSLVNLNLQK